MFSRKTICCCCVVAKCVNGVRCVLQQLCCFEPFRIDYNYSSFSVLKFCSPSVILEEILKGWLLRGKNNCFCSNYTKDGLEYRGKNVTRKILRL